MPAIVYQNLGPPNTPQDVKDLRKSSFDFHRTLGQPIIHKHRWNEMDLRRGLALRCPFHDDIYDQDREYDQWCFGTGYLGGFADGEIVYVTVGDAPEDVFKVNPNGILIHERHPGLVAPWIPEMGDDDLIIIADFDPITLEVETTGDRYLMSQVTPTTIRGPSFKSHSHMVPYRVNQESNIDLLPYNHPFYEVPIVFDYDSVPGVPPIDPDDPGDKKAIFEVGARIIGTGYKDTSNKTQAVKIVGLPSNDTPYTQNVRVTGKGDTTHVFLGDEDS